MSKHDMDYWCFNEHWHNDRVGYIGEQKEAEHLASKPHLIIFEASITEVIEAGLY